MVTENLILIRSNDPELIEFDFSELTPAVDISSEDKIVFRIEDQVAPRMLKRNDAALGSVEEISVDDEADIIEVKLTATERNSLPSSGFNYKLTVNNEILFGGTITVSGTITSSEVERYVSVINGINVRTIDAEFGFANDKFIRYNDDIVTVINTLTNGVEIILDTPESLPGKKYTFVNKGANGPLMVVADSTIIWTIGIDESCNVESNGTNWVITSGRNRVYHVKLNQASTADPTIVTTYKNSVGAIAWTRNNEGEYFGDLDNTFKLNKLVAQLSAVVKSDTLLFGRITRSSDDRIVLNINDADGRVEELDENIIIYFELIN